MQYQAGVVQPGSTEAFQAFDPGPNPGTCIIIKVQCKYMLSFIVMPLLIYLRSRFYNIKIILYISWIILLKLKFLIKGFLTLIYIEHDAKNAFLCIFLIPGLLFFSTNFLMVPESSFNVPESLRCFLPVFLIRYSFPIILIQIEIYINFFQILYIWRFMLHR